MTFILLKSAISLVLSLTSVSAFAISNTQVNETDPLHLEATLNPLAYNPGQGGELSLKMTLPPDYKGYEDQIDLKVLTPPGFKIGNIKVSPVIEWDDKFSKKIRSGFKDVSTLKAYIEAPLEFKNAASEMILQFTYQACTDQFCLFPTKKEIKLPITLIGAPELPQLIAPPGEEIQTSDDSSWFSEANIQKYLGDSLLIGLFFVFLAGIVTSFTPCIFPMIPITLAVLGNDAEKRSRLANFANSLVYVLGIATTYSLLGLVAASTGGLFGASLGNPIVLSVVCLIFLTMALSMYGLFEIQVPAFIRNSLGNKKHQGGSFISTYLTGLFAGIVASPCVGPVLVAILTYVASTQNQLTGFLYLFSYAFGLGLIFIVLGVFNQAARFLPRSGVWMNFTKFILGTLMLSAFFYYLNLLIPERFFHLSLGVALITLASIYGAFIANVGLTPAKRLQKGFMQALLFVGFILSTAGALNLSHLLKDPYSVGTAVPELNKLPWTPYSDQALTEARLNEKPVIIDFWAEWCAACHQLEAETFTDPRVKALAEKFELLKFDATKNSSELKRLQDYYGIKGLPTLVFIDKNGKWIKSLTLTEFEKAPRFLERMEKTLYK